MIQKSLMLLLTLVFIAFSAQERSSGPLKGTLVVDGGGTTPAVVECFVKLAGGPDARIIVIPTGASLLRFGPEKIILNPEWPRSRPEWKAYEKYLQSWLGVKDVVVLHTRDRNVADSEAFTKPLLSATGVFIGAGNSGRHAAAYLGTRTQKDLQAVLDRGGVIFGSSAGAIILGSFTVRGRPDKPLLMARGHEQGFGFLKNVAIDPHLTQAKRENELVDVTDSHPGILGISIDEDAAIVVKHDEFEVIGSGKVAIYDNAPHQGAWYYWLNPGDHFDLATWHKER